ncbi:MAG: fumarylacetoacetate hydrolase family protein [Anaerolineae bacterium]|nr:MAG: fumarylacetoacetate hydrolase family protein [Anaerolineae bacterium]
MRLASYFHEETNKIGIVQNETIIDISPFCSDMLTLIKRTGEDKDLLGSWSNQATESHPLEAVRLLSPVPLPHRNIMCLGLNYAEHAAEHYSASGRETSLPEFPIIFTKATTSINGPYDPIPFDPHVTEELDWEVELAVIISREGVNIPTKKAMDYVFGYAVLNDVSARDLQRKHKQYFKGKSLDGACPMGPWIVTSESIDDPHDLQIVSRVNGEIKQESNTKFMIFRIPEIIAQISLGMTILPGDIIATGTPSGVGFARQPPEFLQPGDMVECEIQGVGIIRNKVIGKSIM